MDRRMQDTAIAGVVGVVLAVVLLVAAVVFADAAGTDTVPAQPCTREEYQLVRWEDGQPWGCKYLPDSRTFEWQPAAPPMLQPLVGG